MKEIEFRREIASDYRAVEELTREAFWNTYVPGCNEHYILHIMRDSETFIKELDIVAEADGQIVGNIVYTRTQIAVDDGSFYPVISFGPISVLPEYQRGGIGGKLISYTKEIARNLGYKAILIFGDPAYYNRYGFSAAENYKIRTAEDMYAAALLATELFPGALSARSGKFIEDPIFNVDETAVEEFERQFPHKERKSGGTAQMRFQELLGMRTPRMPKIF